MESTAKTKRPRPTQDECMQWLRDNLPDLYLKATRERDWIWIKGSRGDHIFTGKTGKLKAYGFRAKQEGSHKFSDGTSAVWYHSCQGKWRPTYKKGSRGMKTTCTTNSMSMSDALEVAALL